MSNAASAVGNTPGALLKIAREAAGLSVERVAKDLFLDIAKIKAIEADQFKDIGAPVYAKGYLRKFARLVNANEEEVLRHYASLNDAPAAADPIPASQGMMPKPRKPLPRWMLWGVAMLIGAAIVMTLLNLHTTEPAVSKQANLVSRPLAMPAAAVTSTAAPSSASSVDATPASGNVSLHFKFSGDSWVEVYDARDQQVLYDTGMANGVRDVNGKPPLRVVLGSASAVTLQVNAQDVVVPSAKIQAGVARFVIAADGTLQ